VYLAEKTGRLIPKNAAARYESAAVGDVPMGGIGPMFGQVGFFVKFAGKDFEDKRPRDRYVSEAKRLLAVLDQRLEGRAWIMGDDYTSRISRRSLGCAIRGLLRRGDLVEFHKYASVQRVLDAFVARPAVQRGLGIPKRTEPPDRVDQPPGVAALFAAGAVAFEPFWPDCRMIPPCAPLSFGLALVVAAFAPDFSPDWRVMPPWAPLSLGLALVVVAFAPDFSPD
jgi:glutathione S-transferase